MLTKYINHNYITKVKDKDQDNKVFNITHYLGLFSPLKQGETKLLENY